MSENEKNYKHKQQDHTELNGDGNRERGRYGEDLSGATDGGSNNNTMSEEEIAEQQFKERLEQLRKRDPFIYR